MKDPLEPDDEGAKASRPEQSAVYTMTDLEQIKVVADPLRLRILEALCRNERTTKQVAQEIDEKPTRLYHHVEALERVGLIRRTRTRQNRGTVEKYYMAVARTFKAGSSLFSGAEVGSPESDSLETVATTIFENTAREIREVIASGAGPGVEEEGILTYAEVSADEKTLSRIRSRFMEVLEEVCDESDAAPKDKGERRFRLLLAYFPLDPGKP